MSKLSLEEMQDDFPLFIEAGFVAVKQFDERCAKTIFYAAQAMRPAHSAPKIGLGYIALNKLEIKEATRIFQDVVKEDPENDLAQTFLGICFLLVKQKRKQGEKLIRETIDKAQDPTIKALGEISLEWAKKDLNKEKAPFFAKKEEGDSPK